MKTIGFLSFGHWAPSPRSETRSAFVVRHAMVIDGGQTVQ